MSSRHPVEVGEHIRQLSVLFTERLQQGIDCERRDLTIDAPRLVGGLPIELV
jgi:hypothetical protein